MFSVNKTEISNLNDDFLVSLSKGGDNAALTELLNRYSDKVLSKAGSYKSLVGIESDDLYQEGMLGLLSAVYAYIPERNTSFSTFSDILVTRKMLSALKSANSKKNLPLREYVSIEDALDLFSTVPTPEEALISGEEMEDINRFIENGLSKTERKVLKLFLHGLSYCEIAEILDCGEKSVDNALQRIRRKFRELQNL